MEKVANILLVEDDNLDVMDVQRTLDKLNILHKTRVAKNGEEALAMLKQVREDPQMEKPDIILLDINMPKMNGIEFLQTVRQHEEWKDLKVFILTTSEEKIDKEATQRLGISGYLVKPLKLNNPSSMDSFNLMIDLLNIKRGLN